MKTLEPDPKPGVEARRVLIIGDSNCLARPNGRYRQTWVYYLKQSLVGVDVILLAENSRTTEYLVLYPVRRPDGSVEYDPTSLEMYEPNWVIVNLGFVDCSPRLFSRGENQILARLPASARKAVISACKRLRRPSTSRAYVKPTAFEANVRQYLERCGSAGVEGVVLIGILSPNDGYRRKNPGIQRSVEEYNAILARLGRAYPKVYFIDPLHPEQRESPLYVEDGYHLSAYGHRLLHHCLMKTLDDAGFE